MDSYPIPIPDCVHRITIDVPSGALAAFDCAPACPTFDSAVLVPGFSGSKEDFVPMLAALSHGGYRVVAFDQRGQYESGGPAEPAAYSMRMFTDDLLSVIRLVGKGHPVHLLGHSFGGLVARRVAIAAPSFVRSLTLLDSGPDGASLLRRRLLGPLTWLIRLGGPKIVAALMARAVSKMGVSDARLSWLRHRLLETDPANLIGICRIMAREPDRVDQLAATSVPLLVLCGEHDDGWSPMTQMDMARRLCAETVIIKRAGHTPNEDQPIETAEVLLQFWRAVDAVTP